MIASSYPIIVKYLHRNSIFILFLIIEQSLAEIIPTTESFKRTQ